MEGLWSGWRVRLFVTEAPEIEYRVKLWNILKYITMLTISFCCHSKRPAMCFKNHIQMRYFALEGGYAGWRSKLKNLNYAKINSTHWTEQFISSIGTSATNLVQKVRKLKAWRPMMKAGEYKVITFFFMCIHVCSSIKCLSYYHKTWHISPVMEKMH